MLRSTERLLTTHTGSLPRPKDLVDLLYAAEAGTLADEAAFQIPVKEYEAIHAAGFLLQIDCPDRPQLPHAGRM